MSSTLPFSLAAAAGTALAISWLCSGCADGGREFLGTKGSFSTARSVIEANCVHCHGKDRLTNMPAFSDSHSLGRLVGANNWIVPGHPERSRFFQVVTLGDTETGAMPPTGHAIGAAEVETLRAWIAAGAPIPSGPPIVLQPRGDGPRSR